MKKQILIAVCASLFVASAAQAQIVVQVAPPVRVYERAPAPPPEHPGWAWHAGYHRWDGERYVWVPGVYEEPPHPGAHWVVGGWHHRRDGYVYTEGRWR